MLTVASLLSAVRAADSEAHIRLLCRADLVARAERLIPVRLNEIIACDANDEASFASFVERVRALPCDIFIAAAASAKRHTHAIASALGAQRTIEAPLAQDNLTDFENYRTLLNTSGIIAEQPRTRAQTAEAQMESFQAQLTQMHRICEEREALIHEQALEIAIAHAAADERLQALQKVQEESERRGVMLTDMTTLAQEQENELVRLRGERLSAQWK